MHSQRLTLHDFAHARAGDKGNRLNLAVFVYREDHYNWLLGQLTEKRVSEIFSHRGVTNVRRYPLPKLFGVNFVLDDVLQGGVNGSLNLDGHGKTLSAMLLSMTVDLIP